ncbi:helix-turn-helix domain-containing protein [Cellulomonas aerilata]|uniref:Putative AraC-family transcriptional regulator n=1 Tax=Cellulomonas aerilata TaxID=515326 RepID=A0A512DH92_9CELL|nr:helix-turn-helix domain-containing protein [Cellulomonas aerilata]GEO35841.1 putative AraC-family transcriptional regulator [Cellulomonas aerilata]
MKPDTAHRGPGEPEPERDRIDRAHLKAPGDRSHTMHRYEPAPDLADLVQRYWVPVWSVPAGRTAPQRVLQYPVCLLVVSGEYARFYGVVSGVSTTVLAGDGWAVGVMLQPAAGHLVARRPVADFTDRHVDVGQVLGAERGAHLVGEVRAAMEADPWSVAAHTRAVAAMEHELRSTLPVDGEGLLVNRLVDLVESRPDVLRVAQICDELGLSERSLQRLVHRRLGLTPKWLIQRRRLQEAAEHLRTGTGTGTVSDLAAHLGYADQPHLHHDFSRVTGMTPGEFVTLHRAAPDAG